MTDQEIIDGSCALKTRFNEILYNFPGNYTDGIPNLSDLKVANDIKTGQVYISSKSYSAGDIVTYKFLTYVSLTDLNVGNIPDVLNSTDWIVVKTINLVNGEIYCAANIFFTMSLDLTSGAVTAISIKGSNNIDSITHDAPYEITLHFSNILSLYDDSYQVQFMTELGQKDGSLMANVIRKDSNSVTFRVIYAVSIFSVGIFPIQKAD